MNTNSPDDNIDTTSVTTNDINDATTDITTNIRDGTADIVATSINDTTADITTHNIPEGTGGITTTVNDATADKVTSSINDTTADITANNFSNTTLDITNNESDKSVNKIDDTTNNIPLINEDINTKIPNTNQGSIESMEPSTKLFHQDECKISETTAPVQSETTVGDGKRTNDHLTFIDLMNSPLPIVFEKLSSLTAAFSQPDGNKQTSIFYSVQRLDDSEAYALTKYLVETHNINIEFIDFYEQTALFYACRVKRNGISTIRYLINYTSTASPTNSGLPYNPSLINYADIHRQTALFYAARFGNADVCRLLLDGGANVNHLDNVYQTPIFYAAGFGNFNCCQLLVEYGKADLSVKDNSGFNVVAFVKNLLTKVTDEQIIKRLSEIVDYLQTNLRQSSTKESYLSKSEMVTENTLSFNELINEKLSIVLNSVDLVGRSFSVKNSLINSNTQSSISTRGKLKSTSLDDSQTSLFFAVQRRLDSESLELCQKLITDHKLLDVVNHLDMNGQTALFYAAKQGNIKTIEYLVEDCSASPTIVDKFGQTALFYAAKFGQTMVVDLFLKYEPNLLNIIDQMGQSALFFACAQGKLATSIYLVEKCSADVEIVDKNGDTAWTYLMRSKASWSTEGLSFRRGRLLDEYLTNILKPKKQKEDNRTNTSIGSRGKGKSNQSVDQSSRKRKATPVISQQETLPIAPTHLKTPTQNPVVTSNNNSIQPVSNKFSNLPVLKYRLVMESSDGNYHIPKIADYLEFQSKYPEIAQYWSDLDVKTTAAFSSSVSKQKFETTHRSDQTVSPFWIQNARLILKALIDYEYSSIFLAPVDPVAHGLPDYFKVIKKPIDFHTILKKLIRNRYVEFSELEEDILLVFSNCETYNAGNAYYINLAEKVRNEYFRVKAEFMGEKTKEESANNVEKPQSSINNGEISKTTKDMEHENMYREDNINPVKLVTDSICSVDGSEEDINAFKNIQEENTFKNIQEESTFNHIQEESTFNHIQEENTFNHIQEENTLKNIQEESTFKNIQENLQNNNEPVFTPVNSNKDQIDNSVEMNRSSNFLISREHEEELAIQNVEDNDAFFHDVFA